MERFVIIVYGFQPLTIITKRSILDVAATLDLPVLKVICIEEDIHTQARSSMRESTSFSKNLRVFQIYLWYFQFTTLSYINTFLTEVGPYHIETSSMISSAC